MLIRCVLQLVIRLKKIRLDVDNEVEDLLYQGLKKGGFVGDVSSDTFGKVNLLSTQKVGATISAKLTKDAIMAVFFSLVLIFLYILVRFDSWQYGLGGVVSTGSRCHPYYGSLLVVVWLPPILFGD